MAISSREEEEIEDSKNRWRRSLLEFLNFSNSAATRKMGLVGVERQGGGIVPKKEVFIGQRGQGHF